MGGTNRTRSKTAFLATLMALAVAGVLALSSMPASAGPGNTITTVDSAGIVGCCTDIAIGTDGQPVISYTEPFASEDLKVAHCGNAACTAGNTLAIVDGATRVVLSYTSIAVGRDGLPIISYYDGGASHLRVAHCGNAACSAGNTLTAPDTGSSGGYGSSIAIGTDGLPVISYDDETGGDFNLKLAHCGNVACTSGNTYTTVDGPGMVGAITSIAIGADGLPVVSYLEIFPSNGTRNLKVAHCGNATCSAANTLTTLVSDGGVGFNDSIAVGSDGLPIISYYDVILGLKVAHCGNAACTAGNTLASVDSSGGGVTSIAVGTDGLPVVSYSADANGSVLKVAHCGNVACSAGNSLSIIDSPTGVNVGSDDSIAMGTDGLPVISYSAGFDLFDLKVAHCGSTTCKGAVATTSTPLATVVAQATATPTRTAGPSLGGVAAYPDVSSGPGVGLVASAVAAALSVVGLSGAWYARRRLIR